MGKILIPGGSGGGINSDELTAVAGDVLKGQKYVGADTNDEIGTGTLELTGNATVGDVITGKTFYINNPKSKQTGTLALSGNAAAGDVISGKTFYTTNPKSKQTGTLALSGNAAANQVLSGRTFYTTDPKTKQSGTIPSYSGRTITPGTANQTIAAGNYISGNVTIAGDGDLAAGNIKNGVSIFGVTGNLRQAKHKQYRNLSPSSSTKAFINLAGQTVYRRYFDLNLGFYPTTVSGMSNTQTIFIGIDTYNYWYYYGGDIYWFNTANSNNGLNWNSTHIYLPVPTAGQYSLDISGYL